jgi:hypothetical protein
MDLVSSYLTTSQTTTAFARRSRSANRPMLMARLIWMGTLVCTRL